MSEQANIRVLHVDDEPDFAELTANFLKREDDRFTVEVATSATKGLEYLSQQNFDCIVSDYDMPGQNGIEFLKSVRKNAHNLPFVLFTGKGSEEIASKAISVGVTDYLQKESGTDQYTVLANRLRNAVRRHRAEKDRKRQRKAIETAQEGISILNEDGEYIYVNQAYADLYGYKADEMTGEHWELIYPDDKTAVVQEVILPTVAEDGYWSGETTGLRADGTTFLEDHTVAQTVAGELICSVRDRTMEQEQEIELTQFRTLVKTLNDPVYVLDEAGQFEYVNDAFVEMVGYDRDTIIGAQPTLIKSVEAADRSESNLGRVLSSDGPDSVRFEIEVQPKQGEPIPCEDHMGVLPYEGDSFEGSVGILRDITERKEREQKLCRTNTVLRTIVESLPMGVLVEDAERDVLMANDMLGETFGMPIDGGELTGHDCATMAEELKDLFVDPERFIKVISERLEQREPVQNEELSLTDGRVLERDYVPYTLPEGEANLWIYRDVTERKQRKQKLDRSRRFLQDTQEVAHIGGWELDIQSGSLRWSDEVYRIHGLPLDTDVTAEGTIKFCHPNDRDSIREALDRLTAEGEPFELDVRIDTVDDDVRWVRSLGEPVYENNELIAARGTLQDITEQKKRERNLEEFANVVSHDLRSPLNVAEGRLELARRECDSEHLDDVASAHNRMKTLIEDLLTLAREGDAVRELEAIDLEGLTRDCWGNIATTEATLSTETSQEIHADQNRLQQLLENLIRNAVEHGDGAVTVTIGELENGFYVEDTGPGIPEDERDNVFEGGYSTIEEGTGFGLGIVERVADAHGWAIQVNESSEGGARFEITGVEFVTDVSSKSYTDKNSS